MGDGGCLRGSCRELKAILGHKAPREIKATPARLGLEEKSGLKGRREIPGHRAKPGLKALLALLRDSERSQPLLMMVLELLLLLLLLAGLILLKPLRLRSIISKGKRAIRATKALKATRAILALKASREFKAPKALGVKLAHREFRANLANRGLRAFKGLKETQAQVRMNLPSLAALLALKLSSTLL